MREQPVRRVGRAIGTVGWGWSAGEQRDRDVGLGEHQVEVGCPHVAVEERDQAVGLDELDAVIGAEVAALVFPPVDVTLGVALIGIDNERFLPLGQLAVGQDVDALVTIQPQAGRLALSRTRAVV